MPFRAGDVVDVPHIKEVWVVAVDEVDGHVFALGWPCSCIDVRDVKLKRAAEDWERLDTLKRVANIIDEDPRRAHARRQLTEMKVGWL